MNVLDIILMGLGGLCFIVILVFCIGIFFNKDICEDIVDDKVSRKYSGEK